MIFKKDAQPFENLQQTWHFLFLLNEKNMSILPVEYQPLPICSLDDPPIKQMSWIFFHRKKLKVIPSSHQNRGKKNNKKNYTGLELKFSRQNKPRSFGIMCL